MPNSAILRVSIANDNEMSLDEKYIHSVLGQAVGPRSHFLPRTPLITIGEYFIDDGTPPDIAQYAVHHEYLHYEQFITWPITLFAYVQQAFVLTSVFAKHHQVQLNNPNFALVLAARLKPLSYESLNWDDNKVAALQGEDFIIGLSALLEGQAILDCFCKPSDSVIRTIGVHAVEALFRKRDMKANRPHIIGVESCLAAVGLSNNDFRNNSKHEMLCFASLLPGIVLMRSMGQALQSLGLPKTGWKYSDIERIIAPNFHTLLSRYSQYVRDGLHKVFTTKRCDEWLLENSDCRDANIVGCHYLMNLFYVAMHEAVPPDAPAFPMLGPQWSILGIIKLFEAMNPRTLSKYEAPLVRPASTPVPTLLFSRRELNGLHLKFEKSGFRYSFGNTMSIIQFAGWLHWCCLAIFHVLAESLMLKRSDATCPFRTWVAERYRQIGVDDELTVNNHLSHMCNLSLAVTADGILIQTKIQPAVGFCTCSLIILPRKVKCLFHSVVKDTLFPTETVAELERKVSLKNVHKKLRGF